MLFYPFPFRLLDFSKLGNALNLRPRIILHDLPTPASLIFRSPLPYIMQLFMSLLCYYRNDSNKRPGRLFNFRRSRGGAYSGGGAYLIFQQTPQSDSIKTQNFDNNLNKNNNNNKDLKKLKPQYSALVDTGWRKKKYPSVIQYNLKIRKAITLKQLSFHSIMANLNFDIQLLHSHAILTEIQTFQVV